VLRKSDWSGWHLGPVREGAAEKASVAAHSGTSGGRVCDLEFPESGTHLFLPRPFFEASSVPVASVRPEDLRGRKGDERRGCMAPQFYGLGAAGPIPKPAPVQWRFWEAAGQRFRG
jgi:hypothetical protein